ncbi:unnamed protein product, partial [Effrenium voratum]
DVFQCRGLANLFQNPTVLDEYLQRRQDVFQRRGLANLFWDPMALDEYLQRMSFSAAVWLGGSAVYRAQQAAAQLGGSAVYGAVYGAQLGGVRSAVLAWRCRGLANLFWDPMALDEYLQR